MFKRINTDEYLNISTVESIKICLDTDDKYYAIFRGKKYTYDSYLFDTVEELKKWLKGFINDSN